MLEAGPTTFKFIPTWRKVQNGKYFTYVQLDANYFLVHSKLT